MDGFSLARDLGQVLMSCGKVDEGLAVLRRQYAFWVGSNRSDHVLRERLGVSDRRAFDNYRAALAFSERWGVVRTLTRNHVERWRRHVEDPESGPLDWASYAWLLLACEPADLRDPSRALSWTTRAVEAERIALEKCAREGETESAANCASLLVKYATEVLVSQCNSKPGEKLQAEFGPTGAQPARPSPEDRAARDRRPHPESGSLSGYREPIDLPPRNVSPDLRRFPQKGRFHFFS